MNNFIVFDVETTDKNPYKAKLVGFACHYLDGDGSCGYRITYHTPDEIIRFKLMLESSDYIKICHNLRYEYVVCKMLGIKLSPPYYDTMLASWLLNLGIPKVRGDGRIDYDYKLKHLAEAYLGYKDLKTFDELAKEYTVLSPTGIKLKNGTEKLKKRPALASDIPEGVLSKYCKLDVEMTYKLYEFTKDKLIEQNLQQLFELECSIIPTYASMEENGMKVDVPYLEKYKIELTNKIDEITNLFGNLNLSSNQQLGEYIEKALGIPIKIKTKTGKPQVTKQTLYKLVDLHPEVTFFSTLLKYKALQKVKTTYVERWLERRDEKDRVHFYFNQIGAVSGRSSSDGQQIPKVTNTASLVRKALIAELGYKLISADFSQIEPRIMAHVSGDKTLIDLFKKDIDIYNFMVERFGTSGITIVRDQAKTIVLAIFYGKTAWSLAKEFKIDENQAQRMISEFLNIFPMVKVWMAETLAFARKNGYVVTLLGRRRKISSDICLKPKWCTDKKTGKYYDVTHFAREAVERIAINSVIQGSAADIFKLAIQAIYPKLKASKIVNCVHDDLIFETPSTGLNRAVKIIRQVLENCYKLVVPLKVKIQVGNDLADLAEIGGE